MAYVELFDELKSHLPAGLPLHSGREALSVHTSPPLLVIYPTRDDYTPPERAAAEPGRVTATRVVGMELVLWGRDYAQVEGMVHEAVAALRRIASSQLRLEGGEWGEEGVVVHGKVYFLRFSVNVPIVIPERFAVLESVAAECEVNR